MPHYAENGSKIGGMSRDSYHNSKTSLCNRKLGFQVSYVLEHNSSLVVWSIVFVREAFPEDDSVAQFFGALDGMHSIDSLHDMVIWNLKAIGNSL